MVILLLALAGVLAAQTPERVSATVAIDMSCGDDALRNLILSTFRAEIRKLGDVGIVDKNELPVFTINIVAMPTHNAGGMETGYAMHVMTFYNLRWISMVMARSADPSIKQLSGLVEGSGVITDGGMYTGTRESLSRQAQSFVADFDVSSIEPLRKTLHVPAGNIQ